MVEVGWVSVEEEEDSCKKMYIVLLLGWDEFVCWVLELIVLLDN